MEDFRRRKHSATIDHLARILTDLTLGDGVLHFEIHRVSELEVQLGCALTTFFNETPVESHSPEYRGLIQGIEKESYATYLTKIRKRLEECYPLRAAPRGN